MARERDKERQRNSEREREREREDGSGREANGAYITARFIKVVSD